MSSNNTSDHSSLFDSATSTPRHIRTPSSVTQYPSKPKSRVPSLLLVNEDSDFLTEVNRVLEIEKDNSDADMLSLYYQLKQQPQCEITHDLMDLIHAFLSIPQEKFGLASFARVLEQLAFCFAEAVDEQLLNFYSAHFVEIIHELTSLAAILSGALSVKKPEECLIPTLDQIILTQYNFLKDLEQYIPFFQRKRVYARIKATEQAGQQQSSLRRELVSIEFYLFDQLDLLDGMARSQLKLEPPKFPSNVSPVERILEFMMDKLETGDFSNIVVIEELGSQFTHEKASRNFHQDNPFIFDVRDDENDIFSEQNNNFYKFSAVFPRPRILDALAACDGPTPYQRGLFVLEVQAQFLNLMSFLSEEVEKSFSILDYQNILNVVKFLSEIVNCCFPYIIKNYLKLQQILEKITFKQFQQMYEQFLSKISEEYTQFMRLKLGYINVQFIAYQYLLEMLVIIHDTKGLSEGSQAFCQHIPLEIKDEPLDLANFSQTAVLSNDDTAFFRFYMKEDIFVYLLELIKIYVAVLCDIASSPPIEYKSHYETQDTLLQQALAEMRTARFTDDFVKQALNSQPECPEVRQLVQELEQKYEEQRTSIETCEKDELATPPLPEASSSRTGSAVFVKAACLPKTPTLQDFVPIQFVSKGGYGCVVHVMNKQYRHHFAIKIIRKEDIIRKNSVNRVKLEEIIYRHIKECTDQNTLVSFVVKFYGSFKTEQFLFLVLEYCPHGDLGMMLECCGCFTHATTLEYISEIALALYELHEIGIVYNDLKPENVLLAPSGHVKFTDFGISKLAFIRHQCGCPNTDTSPHISAQPSRASFSFGREESLGNENATFSTNQIGSKGSFSTHAEPALETRRKANSVVGTPYYLAPEILEQQGSSSASDYWALGICLYEFTFGIRPFDGDSPDEIFNSILNDEPRFFDECFQEGIQDNCGVVEVIRRLLVKDPAQRLRNFDELREMRFFEGIKWEDLLGEQPTYVPAPIRLSEQPMKIQGDWVDFVVSEAGFVEGHGESIPGNVDDQFEGFSYVNVEAYKELQERAGYNQNSPDVEQ